MKKVELSPELYRRLVQRAQSFEDTAEDVIRRLLDSTEGGAETKPDPGAARAAPGSILPEREYWLPILRVLVEADGSAKANDVIDAIEPLIADRLTQADYEPLQIGEMRWRNRARFARLRMRERGLLSPTSGRGVWEITDEGRRFLNERPPG